MFVRNIFGCRSSSVNLPAQPVEKIRLSLLHIVSVELRSSLASRCCLPLIWFIILVLYLSGRLVLRHDVSRYGKVVGSLLEAQSFDLLHLVPESESGKQGQPVSKPPLTAVQREQVPESIIPTVAFGRAS
jgi:hypothetical protein